MFDIDIDNQSGFLHPGTQPDSTPTPTSTPAPFSIPSTIPSSTPLTAPSLTPIAISLSKKRKLTSDVWQEFEKLKIKGEEFAICHHCRTKLRAPSKNGTSHLREHLKRCMKRKNVDIRQYALVNPAKSGKMVLESPQFEQERSRNDLARAIIVHEYPLTIVDHVAFRVFLSRLQPNFNIVTRNTIKNDILKMFESNRAKAYHMFDNLQSRVAITTDMWSSKQKKGYMAVTTHFVDEAGKLRSMIIGFIYVPAPHTKEVLCDALCNCLLDWNLDRKISTITVDNCSTNDALINALLDKLCVNGSLLLDGQLFHMRCAAHILNLVVRDGLDVIEGAIEKVRDSVVYWTATQGRGEKFKEAAHQLRIPCNKKLSLDCKTRWNSTYLMLETALSYKDVFPRLKQRERHYTSLPSEDDWCLAKEICGRLKLFYGVTELFSGTKYPTTNFLLPKICEVEMALRSWYHSEIEEVRNMAAMMLQKFNKYWSECHVVGALAVILDPRFKMKLLQHIFRKVYGEEDAPSHLEDVLKICYDLLHEYQIKYNLGSNEESRSGQSSSSRDAEVVEGLGDSGEFNIFAEYYNELGSDTLNKGSVKSKLDYYLAENVSPHSRILIF